VDKIGILDKDFTDHFVQRRERALRDFVAHFKDAFDDAVIIDAVVKAEEAFLLQVLQDLDGIETEKGKTSHSVSFKNIFKVMVVLFEPSEKGFKELKKIKELSRPDRVYLFDIEGKYHLPEYNTKARIDAALGSFKKFPPPSIFQRKLLQKVFRNAEHFLNGMAGIDAPPCVRYLSDSI
jgi:hypothetical protein